jgi:DNA-binding protein Fis
MIYEGDSRTLLNAFLTNYAKYMEFFKKMSDKETEEYINSLEKSIGKKKLMEMSEIFFNCRISYDMFLLQVEKDMDEMVFRYVEKNKDNITFN